MKRFCKRVVGLAMVIALVFSTFGGITAVAEDVNLTDEQARAISMLNYVTVLTQEINDAKNSRVFMEEAYSELINNTYPNSIDNRTLNQLTGLLDTMERFRMTNVKRDRLQYIYEQNQAKAIRSAIPNPLGMLSAVHSLSPARLISSILYMAVDSYTSYTTYTSENDLQNLKDGWALDDEEAATLHESRKNMFSFMVKVVNDYHLPGEWALTEQTVEEFVKWKNNDNVVAKIQFLESNKEIYKYYGGYWITLAQSYYENNELQKCIDAVTTYEGMRARIFRWDFYYAKILPLAIAAAEQVLPEEEYITYAAQRAAAIDENTRGTDWALKYFAAQTFVDVYDKTNDKTHLEKAYKIVGDNVNYLADEQKKTNETYIAPYKDTEIPNGSTNKEKDQINAYNKTMREARKTELPPVSDALVLNCELMFALAEKLDVPETEKARVDALLHPQNERLFLTEPLDNKYWFNLVNQTPLENIDIAFGGPHLIIPVSFLTTNAKITVTINDDVVLDDWVLENVERKTEGDISTYGAAFRSEHAHNHAWQPDEKIKIVLVPDTENDVAEYVFEYVTEGAKKNWYDYFVPWQGQKNYWYDYLKVWDNSVNFVRVK